MFPDQIYPSSAPTDALEEEAGLFLSSYLPFHYSTISCVRVFAHATRRFALLLRIVPVLMCFSVVGNPRGPHLSAICYAGVCWRKRQHSRTKYVLVSL